jgi:TRAP transporter TAXI family solute receptor
MKLKLTSILAASVIALAFSTTSHAQSLFRIATGATGGTYYPVGGIIATSVSQPDKLVVSAQASSGSVANVNGISRGDFESGFSQSDVATWAYQGKMIFDGKPRQTKLRLIASLYPETIHVVVRKDSGIRSVADLKGKRVSLDMPGSGTLVNALMVLKAYGVNESDILPEYIKTYQAADKLQDGELDAFFFVGGSPASVIEKLIATGTEIELLPITGAGADSLRANNPYLVPGKVAEGTYRGVAGVQTLDVGAQWLTNASADADVVYQITKTLFSEATQKALQSGHARGKLITLENAVTGAGIPLHPGAEKFYKEAGMLK